MVKVRAAVWGIAAIVAAVVVFRSCDGGVRSSEVPRPSVAAAKSKAIESREQLADLRELQARSAEPTSESAASSILRVWMGSGVVAGARVVLGREGRVECRTSGAGEVDIGMLGWQGRSLAILAPGAVTAFLSLPEKLPQLVEVHLREASVLTGIVLSPDGLPLEGLRVLAVDPQRYFDPDVVAGALRGLPLVPLAMTDENGQFSLEGLDPRKGYQIFAGGKGFVSFDPFAPPVSADPYAYREVHTARIYGVRLVFRDLEGKPPLLASDLNGKWHGQARPLVRARSFHPSEPTGALLGLASDSTLRESPYDKVLFFVSQEDLGPRIPLRFSAQYPGYLPIDVLVDAESAVEAISSTRVTLVRNASGFGDVLVELGPPEWIPAALPTAGTSAGCTLRLEPLAGGAAIEARLTSLAGGLELVQGIPHGDYRLRFLAPHQLFWFPRDESGPLLTRIGDEPGRISVDLAGLGSLCLEVMEGAQVQYDGAITGTLIRLPDREMDAFHFFRGPYCLPLLPPGEYTVRLEGPSFAPGADRQTVSVHAGESREIRFSTE